jgi:hypothetical protein
MLSYTLWPVLRYILDLGGGGGRYFYRFYLAVFNPVLIAINKYRITHNLHF